MIDIELFEEDKKARQSLGFLKKIFSNHTSRDFSIRLWDGSILPSTGVEWSPLHLELPVAICRHSG